ncbi:MAG: glutamate-5-semialdehyde dehydrogenase [Limnochordaceae bacterium]|nr:glutamate-5-semialdehyde dehydrogenase [Limnochordaceae bacterium]
MSLPSPALDRRTSGEKGEPSPEETVRRLASGARQAARLLARMESKARDRALLAMAAALRRHAAAILQANRDDVERARAAGLRAALVDRLLLDEVRLERVARGIEQVAALEDPLARAVRSWRRPNGLEITEIRVPLGVIGVIYESRPDVTADAAALCIKSANAVVLRGGSEALETSLAIGRVLAEAAQGEGVPEGAIAVVPTADRRAAVALMHARGWIDLLIPRGGPELIRTVVEQASVPVIETGAGNCHIYLDASASYEMAERIVLNAKIQRPTVCNAVETLLVHRDVAARGDLARLGARLRELGVEIRGCPATREVIPQAVPATEADWATEYLDLILAVRVVESLDEALEHIARYSTGHSEAIVTQDLAAARRFVREVDSAAVYVNASTRFTDGGEFGFGAEIGISTQKLHARGPMGLEALTTTRFVVFGDGQVRE